MGDRARNHNAEAVELAPLRTSQDDGEVPKGSEERSDDGWGLEDEEEVVMLRRRTEMGEGMGLDADDPVSLVAKVVPETDDPTLPTLTFRALVLGSFFCIIGAAFSQLFFFKDNAPNFSSFFVILASYPLGKWMARVLPERDVSFLGYSFSLNPGPFNVKEHVLLGTIATTGGTSAYATDILSIQNLFYHQEMGAVASITLLLTTQLIGYGLAGIVQKVLVRPPKMYWPSSLVTVSLFTTFHDTNETTQKKTQDKLHFFILAFTACFLYHKFFMPTLTSIATLCVINNNSLVMRTLGSGYKGFGLGNISLDWSAISTIGPLFTPWFAQVNFLVGLIGMMWLVTPILYFSNFWDALSFPSPVTSGLFDSSYRSFDVNSVLNPADLTLNEAAWEQHKPMLLTPYFAISYGLSFAALSSVVSHVLLWHSKDIKEAFFELNSADDVHNRMMRRYPEVPSSWFFAMLGGTFLCAAVLCIVTPIQLPIWALALAILMAAVFLIPVGIIAAVSGTAVGLNVITELVIGFLLPGRPIANVAFKCFGYQALAQALGLTEDLKLGLYLKIPPRKMFITQSLGTVIGAVVNYLVLSSVISAKRPYLDGTLEDPTGQWTGRSPHIFFSASVIWGLIGPARFFSGKYALLYLGFPLGFLAPLIPWLLHRRWPNVGFKSVTFPIVCHAAMLVPQVPTNVITSGAIAAYLSQVYAARKHPKWYAARNYTLSAALDAATSVNALVVYAVFTLFLGGWSGPHWWANPTGDAEHCTPGT